MTTNIMDFAGIAGLITAAGTAIGAILAGLSLNDRLKKALAEVERLEAELNTERKNRLDCAEQMAEMRGELKAMRAKLDARL